jgi:beta-galactosidase/beta-glucuronidase
MRAVATLVSLCALMAAVLGAPFFQEVSLSSSDSVQWTLRECSEANDYALGVKRIPRFAASVPGNVHTDLMSAGLLEGDPYYRYNEVNMSWVTAKCWLYELDLPNSLFKSKYDHDVLHIRANGLDNVATVFVNNIVVGTSSNSFRTFYFPVDLDILTRAADVVKIAVRLDSVAAEAKKRAAQYPYEVPATENWNVWAEPSSRNFVRKAGSDFGEMVHRTIA